MDTSNIKQKVFLSQHQLIARLSTTRSSFKRRSVVIAPDAFDVVGRPLYLLENLEAIRRLFESTLTHPVVTAPVLAA